MKHTPNNNVIMKSQDTRQNNIVSDRLVLTHVSSFQVDINITSEYVSFYIFSSCQLVMVF